MATKNQAAKEQSMVTIVCGVTNCGGGWVILGGKLVKIPPRGPLFDKISNSVKEIIKDVKAYNKK